MNQIPDDPLRSSPMSFDQWKDSFEVPDKDERLRLSKAAEMLLRNPIFERVLSRVEVRAIDAMKQCSISDNEALRLLKSVLHGTDEIRRQLRMMADDAEYLRKTATNK